MSNFILQIMPVDFSNYPSADGQLDVLIEFLDELIKHDDYEGFDYGVPDITNYSNFGVNSEKGTADKDISGINVTFENNKIADTLYEIYNVRMNENTMPKFLDKNVKITLVV